MGICTFNGKVKRVTVKELAQEDRFGNTYRHSMQLDDDAGTWVGFGGSKSQNFTVKDGANFYTFVGGETIFLKYEEKGGFRNGKKGDITLIEKSEEGSAPPQKQAVQKPANTSGSNKKVFGDITDITNGVATVNDEKAGEVKVILAEREGDVQVGGRLTATIDGKGTIVSGFKAYGPKVAKDDLGIKVGNSFSVALEAGFVTASKDITETLPELVAKIDAARDTIAKANPSMDSYALGARFGQSVVSAARLAKKGTGIDKILEEAVVIFNALNEVENVVRAKGDAAKLEPTKTVSQAAEPSASEPFSGGEDFSDDIPFASLGLQYSSHAIHALF